MCHSALAVEGWNSPSLLFRRAGSPARADMPSLDCSGPASAPSEFVPSRLHLDG